jgi:hypothetical protein
MPSQQDLVLMDHTPGLQAGLLTGLLAVQGGWLGHSWRGTTAPTRLNFFSCAAEKNLCGGQL